MADAEDHCTIAVSFTPDGPLVGHNEDWDTAALKDLYLLKATLPAYSLFGIAYASAIPGGAAMTNSYGLIQCINEMHQQSQLGVPKSFLARAVLECSSLGEAELLLRTTKRAAGYNHVLIQADQVRNIEIAGDQLAVEKASEGTYLHTNHYLITAMQEYEKFHTKSSTARYQRASQLLKPDMAVAEMQSLLSDSSNQEYPICNPLATIASLIFVPHESKVHVAKGHPCQSIYRPYLLP